MRLLRYRDNGTPRLGALKGDGVVPLSALGWQGTTMLGLIEAGEGALAPLRDALGTASPEVALADVALLAPIERPGKYLAVGMNYPKHADELVPVGVARATHQVWFNKQTTCLSGPFDPIEPGVSTQLDHEVELGAVIGRRAKNVREEDAQDYVFGYFVVNDVSARDYQFHSRTMMMGKGFDTHGPIGPWIVTSDEIPDPHSLDLRCFVNGEMRQSSNTSQMTHSLWQQIAYLTSAFTLEPGDLIATGTPEGVGVARQPPLFLQPGDLVRCEIDGIGAIENRVAG